MSASVTTTVTKNIAMPGTSPVNNQYQLSGAQPLGYEHTVTYGVPVTVNDGIGVLVKANLQLIYLLSDNLDCTVTFMSLTAGGGSTEATFTLIAGVAQEWDTQSGTNPFTASCLSMVVTPAQTVNGQASALTTTDVHIRAQLSA